MGAVLLQMGGPRSPEELGPFMRALFQDREMIRLPGWLGFAQGILGGVYGTLRARKLRDGYEQIGWSPLVGTLEELADEIEARLDGEIEHVELAMRYTPPRAQAAVQALEARGVEHVVALPLYPFFSLATTGSSLKDLRSARDEVAPGMRIEAIHEWGTLEGHVDLVADRLARTLATAGEGLHAEGKEHDSDTHERGEDAPARSASDGTRAVLLSAHGVPRAYIDRDGDPYPQRVETAAAQLSARFPDERVELAFQSDIGPVSWLDPSTPEAIDRLAADGVEELVLVPFGFVAEHIETLEEIDQEYRAHAHAAGIDTVHRVPTFGSDEDFADLLAGILRDRLEVPA